MAFPTSPSAAIPPLGLPGGSGTPPTGGSPTSLNADSNPDAIAQLQPVSISDASNSPIYFPAIMFKEEQSNALAIHMYPNTDGALVEQMGRNPGVYHVRALLTNNVYPGVSEQWKPGTLFPIVFNKLISLLGDTASAKIFTHPVYGDVNTQVSKWTYELNPKGPRDGAIVDMELIEAIPELLSVVATPPPGSGLASAANALDAILAATPSNLSPPGMSLSQFFGQINGLIQEVIAVPNNIIASLNSSIFLPISNGISSIGGNLISAPAYVYNSTLFQIQSSKNSVLTSTIQNAVAYDESTFQATQAMVALNNQPSQNAYQLINKTLTAIAALLQHYTDQNNAQCAPVIEALRQYMLQLQQIQSALSNNSDVQGVVVSTYVTPTNMSWMQLTNHLNNTVDQLMNLNQGLVNDFWIPCNTNVNYYQG